MTFLKYSLPSYSREIMSSHLQFTRDCGYESDDKDFEYVKGRSIPKFLFVQALPLELTVLAAI